MVSRWMFLIDECIEPEVAYQLDGEHVAAEPVKDALWLGAKDFADVLPHARDHDQILVTSNVTDFRGLDDDEHEGIILVFGNELRPEQIVSGIREVISQYPSRDDLRGYEKLDPWI